MSNQPDIHAIWQNAQDQERKIWTESKQPESYFINHWTELLRRTPLIRRSLLRANAILDVACGGVPILHVLPPAQLMVATDPLNPDFAALYPRQQWIRYDSSCAESLPYEDATFDVVFCMNALDHMSDPPTAVQQMLRVLKPGGWLHLDITNSSPLSRLLAQMGYRRHLSEFHPHLLTLSGVCSWLRSGCEVMEVETFPACSFRKLLYGFRVLAGKNQLDECQKRISALSLPHGQMFVSVLLDVCNGALYRFNKKTFAQGGRIAARKKSAGGVMNQSLREI
jgi:SAM-dependent methyltransferase